MIEPKDLVVDFRSYFWRWSPQKATRRAQRVMMPEPPRSRPYLAAAAVLPASMLTIEAGTVSQELPGHTSARAGTTDIASQATHQVANR